MGFLGSLFNNKLPKVKFNTASIDIDRESYRNGSFNQPQNIRRLSLNCSFSIEMKRDIKMNLYVSFYDYKGKKLGDTYHENFTPLLNSFYYSDYTVDLPDSFIEFVENEEQVMIQICDENNVELSRCVFNSNEEYSSQFYEENGNEDDCENYQDEDENDET